MIMTRPVVLAERTREADQARGHQCVDEPSTANVARDAARSLVTLSASHTSNTHAYDPKMYS